MRTLQWGIYLPLIKEWRNKTIRTEIFLLRSNEVFPLLPPPPASAPPLTTYPTPSPAEVFPTGKTSLIWLSAVFGGGFKALCTEGGTYLKKTQTISSIRLEMTFELDVPEHVENIKRRNTSTNTVVFRSRHYYPWNNSFYSLRKKPITARYHVQYNGNQANRKPRGNCQSVGLGNIYRPRQKLML